MFPPNYFGALNAAGSGTGPYEMLVRVVRSDNAANIPGATVAASGNQTASGVTDGDGLATLNLGPGSVTLLVRADGYANAAPVVDTVGSGGNWGSSGTGTTEVEMTPNPTPTPPAGSDAVVYAYARKGDGTAFCGKQFWLMMVSSNTGNDLWSGAPYLSSRSLKDTGEATAAAVLGATYQGSLDGENWTEPFTVNTSSFHLAEIIGPSNIWT